MGRTAIVVVTYNHREVIADCVQALDRAGLNPAEVRLYLVDNASTDGTAAVIRQEILDGSGTRTRGGLPLELIVNPENLGYAGGNNLAITRAAAAGDAFVYVLNPDTEVEPGFLQEALAVAQSDPAIACVQSLLLRHDDPGVVNTYGNAIHFLGFGYAAGDGERLDDPAVAARLCQVREVAFASGAASLLRLAVLEKIGGFSPALFAYQEDLELGWRARLAGFRTVVAPRSRVRHKYVFGRGKRKFFFLERNRLLVLGWCYGPRSLALLAPALVAMEGGVWAMAVRDGWWREKAAATAEVGRALLSGRLLAERRRVQGLRVCDEAEATALFEGALVFSAVSPWLLRAVANPLFSAYWRAIRRCL